MREPPIGETIPRIDLLAKGIPYGKPGENNYNFWLSASSQAALKELYLLESDEQRKYAYKIALRTNAISAIPHMRLFKNYDNNSKFTYRLDWRFLNQYWKPQKDCWEARKLGLEQVYYVYNFSPRNRLEFDYMTEPLFAAWVISLSQEKELIALMLPEIREALTYYDWSGVYHATMFIAESVYFESLPYGS